MTPEEKFMAIRRAMLRTPDCLDQCKPMQFVRAFNRVYDLCKDFNGNFIKEKALTAIRQHGDPVIIDSLYRQMYDVKCVELK